MTRIKAGISQIGGKYRFINRLKRFIPPHRFFLSLFCGACWFELNKPRCQYECFNDANSEIINYLKVIERNPKEFDKSKQGIFGLVSEEIFKEIASGELKPKNDLERAVFFQYINKLGFAGTATWRGINPKGGFPIKASWRGISMPTSFKADKASYKGLQVKTTRPYTNNDNGLLTPIDPHAVERLRYVNLANKDFRKVYNLFYKAVYERKGLTNDVFVFADPPYPSHESYYGNLFLQEDHMELITLMLDSPFRFMLTIGGKCKDYIEILKGEGWFIVKALIKYATDANTQFESEEYICMNYDIKKTGIMIDNSRSISEFL